MIKSSISKLLPIFRKSSILRYPCHNHGYPEESDENYIREKKKLTITNNLEEVRSLIHLLRSGEDINMENIWKIHNQVSQSLDDHNEEIDLVKCRVLLRKIALLNRYSAYEELTEEDKKMYDEQMSKHKSHRLSELQVSIFQMEKLLSEKQSELDNFKSRLNKMKSL